MTMGKVGGATRKSDKDDNISRETKLSDDVR